MPKTKVEVYDKNQLIYPFIESDHVTFSNGMKVTEMLDQSISMPTVTHEDLSFKVGVGDQDVSSAIVDSSVAEMTIKGKTYQNILPEPSTHVLTNNKEMFKVNEGLDPNVEIVDGVSKSAILSGNTLVNLVKKATINVESNQNDLWININKLYGGNLPKGKYILLYNIKKASSSTFRCTPRINLSDGTALYEGYENYNTTSGIKKWIFNATAEITDVYFWINTNTEPILVEDFILLEYQQGMENWDIPYFEGMQSVKLPVLTTTGKNLFDINGDINQKYSNMSASKNPNLVNGTTIIASSNSSSHHGKGQKIKVERGEEYTCSFSSTNGGIIEINTPLKLNYVYGKESTFTFTAPTDCDEIIISFSTKGVEANGEIHNFQLEQGTKATSYEPYKSNILTVNEPVELRGIGDVKDTLDCLTGEVTQRIGEYTIDGNENWAKYDIQTVEGYNSFVATIPELNNLYEGKKSFISGDFKMESWHGYYGRTKEEMVWNHDPNKIGIKLKNETVSNVAELKAYLASNPITFQYELATPVIKTVDLSSSGNWEKVVLDGSEDESWGDGDNGLSKTHRFYVTIPNLLSGNHSPIIDSTYFTPIQTGTSSQDTPCVQIASNKIHFRIERQIANSLTSFKTWLQQNPLTVWYPTTTHQDSTQVKQPIFFKDGHIQLSSGVDNSLIPTLDYQAKTSNSYVMDLMKTNTKYTMKAKSASGTFTIDGTSYGAGTNGTFTTPTSMANKFLVMSNKTNEEVMILEGDVTSKIIPYFKGIKSAFEGEDKIEVLSQNKNLLWNLDANNPDDKFVSSGGGTSAIKYSSDERGFYTTSHRTISVTVKPNTKYTLSVSMKDRDEGTYDYRWLLQTPYAKSFGSSCKEWTRYSATFTTDSTGVVRVNIYNTIYFKDMMLEECSTMTDFDLCETNTTKIPLLSSLKNVPNGVYDEVILDRENNKAKIIQRVGKVVLDGSESWGSYANREHYFAMSTRLPNCRGGWDTCYSRCDKVIYNTGVTYDKSGKAYTLGAENDSPSSLYLCLPKSELSTPDSLGFKQWLKENQPTVLYRLETPVITEVDLEGFPYIYKDGHIFLNSDIVPTMEITYSINQCQQISASNEDIIRHEKELTYLQKLIAQYVQVDYESALLSLKV